MQWSEKAQGKKKKAATLSAAEAHALIAATLERGEALSEAGVKAGGILKKDLQLLLKPFKGAPLKRGGRGARVRVCARVCVCVFVPGRVAGWIRAESTHAPARAHIARAWPPDLCGPCPHLMCRRPQ